MRSWRSLRSFSPAVRLLVLNQLGVNVGFYMLLPYLAIYLTGDLGISVALTGLLLGVRNLAQQGLTLVGGSLGDRFGFRAVILGGLAFRSVAFVCFALLDSLPGVVVATILTGLAGALFSPAVRAYIAVEAVSQDGTGHRRAEAFALFNLAGNLGMFLGPMVGALLITVDFRVVAIAAAVVFAGLAVAQLFALPSRPVPPAKQSARQDLIQVLRDRTFLAFAIAASAIFALHNQFYLTLPLEMTRITGVESSTALIFGISAVVTLAVQVRLAAWCRRRWHPGKSLGVGMVVSAGAFVPLLASAIFVDVGSAVRGAVLILALIPIVVTTALLGVGEAMGQPFALDRVGAMSPPELSGTYFGMFIMVSGFAATAANAGVGYVRDLATAWDQPWLTWAALLLLGLAGAVGVLVMHRAGRLADRQSSAAHS